MNIVILDRRTLGLDIDMSIFDTLGNVTSYDTTKANETIQRLQDADIVITNKVVISKEVMDNSNLKLVCISATGMNNVDLEYAKQKKIAVKNVAGYSSSSVVQLAFSMIFQIVQKLDYYKKYVDEEIGKNLKYLLILINHFMNLMEKKWESLDLETLEEILQKKHWHLIVKLYISQQVGIIQIHSIKELN